MKCQQVNGWDKQGQPKFCHNKVIIERLPKYKGNSFIPAIKLCSKHFHEFPLTVALQMHQGYIFESR